MEKKKMTEEYKAALDKVMAVKKDVADGKATVADLKEAIAEARIVKEKQHILKEAEDLISENDMETDPEDDDEDDLSLDDVDEILHKVLKRIDGEKNHEHAYIIGYKHGNSIVMGVNGDTDSLEAMFYSLSSQRPFVDLKPLDDKARDILRKFAEDFK